MMAHHPEDGFVQEWTSRCLACRRCGFDFIQQRGEEDSCPACGEENNYDLLEEYFD